MTAHWWAATQRRHDSGNADGLHRVLVLGGRADPGRAADVLVLTPVCAHNVHAAPLVFAADRHLKIVADAENRDGSFACADSSAQCDLLPGESLLVTGCGQRLRLIAFDDAEQFHAIENN